jgi:hypothetical protein
MLWDVSLMINKGSRQKKESAKLRTPFMKKNIIAGINSTSFETCFKQNFFSSQLVTQIMILFALF